MSEDRGKYAETASHQPMSGAPLYVHQGGEPTPMTPTQLLAAFESGQIKASTQISIQRDAPPQPLRRYLRELVWLEYQENYRRYVAVSEPMKYQAAFENAPIGMVLSDIAGRIQHVNARFAEMLGYTAQELIGTRVGEISVQDDRASEIELGNRVISGELPSFQMEKRFLRNDRTVLDTLLSVSLARDTSGSPRHVIAHVLELTERKQLEQELARRERLAAIGQFAAGVAHDVNNLLQVILLSALDIDQRDPEKNRGAAEAIQDAVNRGMQWTAQLRSTENIEPKYSLCISPDATLKSLHNVLQGMLGNDIKLTLLLQCGTREIPVRQPDFERMMLNLVTNAAQAMTDGGHLQVTTEVVQDATIRVIVSDTGHGMSQDVLSRALEPKFSTRKTTGGTGFGLSFVQEEVARSGGEITIASELNEGTSVTMAWPIAPI